MPRRPRRYGNRASTPRYNAPSLPASAPSIAKSVRCAIESSTDRSAGERCCLQRLTSGETRILLLDRFGTAATHGYPVTLAEIGDGFATLVYESQGYGSDEYVVSAEKWAELMGETAEPDLDAAGIELRARRARSALEIMVREAPATPEHRRLARQNLRDVVSLAMDLAEEL
jgi:hypothetical protein